MSTLFRKEASEHFSSAGHGAPQAPGGPVQSLLVLIIVALAIAIVAYLFVGRIARKQTVLGLASDGGDGGVGESGVTA